MIDLHTHVVPSVDDGVRTLEEAVDLVARAAGEGVTVIAATPHVRGDYPTSADAMEAGVAEVRGAVAAAGLAIEIVEGGELDLEWLARVDDDELLRFSYGGRGSAVLLEFPDRDWPRALEPVLARVRRLGLAPVLAHPERNSAVQERPELLRPLVEDGVLVQITSVSLLGQSGRGTAATAARLLRERLVQLLASDAHGPAVRPYALAAAAAAVGDPGLAAYLTEEAPAALLAGARAGPPPRRRRFRMGRA